MPANLLSGTYKDTMYQVHSQALFMAYALHMQVLIPYVYSYPIFILSSLLHFITLCIKLSLFNQGDKMKLTLYTSLLTSKKTWLIAAMGKCGHKGYKEVQIVCEGGKFHWRITDGYTVLKTGHHNDSLKSALNIAEGYCKSL